MRGLVRNLSVLFVLAGCITASGEPAPSVGAPVYLFSGTPVDGPVEMEGSFTLVGHTSGSQLLFSRPLRMMTMLSSGGEECAVAIPLEGVIGTYEITATVAIIEGAWAKFTLALDSGAASSVTLTNDNALLAVRANPATQACDTITLRATGLNGDCVLRVSNIQCRAGDQCIDINPAPPVTATIPTPRDIVPSALLERELIEWDWLMQDGIGAGQAPATYALATEKTLTRGDALLAELQAEGIAPDAHAATWNALHAQFDELRAANVGEGDSRWEDTWRRVHEARRQMMFANPLANVGPLLFVKQAPGVFSHQLTQCYGRYARPGGGIFVLDRPGESMTARSLAAGALPQGSYMNPEIAYDASRILFAFCPVDRAPEDTFKGAHGHYYHLYEMAPDGSSVRQVTDGAFDDFAPKELPDGRVVFISTRRGGWHRCGTPGCEVYTLALMNGDGTGIRTVSYHETQEWDPAVLNDGRVIYTRWDYVDRNAVYYEQLWTVRPDGTAPAAFYGNNTFNPVGVWEARAVPGSNRVMATAAAHHAMTAGSIILLDVTRGIDGLEPITRLTPEALFPEGETTVLPGWRSAINEPLPPSTPEMERWPGQCYRSPYPLSEKFFLAAYSYDALIGEPKGNAANMFGLYLVDAFGNKELIYRDPNIASLWPLPLRPRTKPPALAPASDLTAAKEGVYLLQNVYDSDPAIEPGAVKRLRIVQVLPKSTSGANNPTVGAANASPGKQVLGTVPVESDGSAHFRAPAGIALAFQALDELGQAVQVMRSVSYLQPGETASCVGCHESRRTAPAATGKLPLAAQRPPSDIAPPPDGAMPLSYPILVQPVLDNHCVQCHGGEKPAGPEGKPIVLTGAPDGRYTTSYNALIERVSYSAWGRGAFPGGNCEPLAKPGFFGAKGSPLMKMLLAGHHDLRLAPEDVDRLVTWMDANALFYGTFNHADQARQQRGERIEGPELQ